MLFSFHRPSPFRRGIIILSAVFSATFLSCVSYGNRDQLTMCGLYEGETESLGDAEQDYNALIVWRLRIHDRTRYDNDPLISRPDIVFPKVKMYRVNGAELQGHGNAVYPYFTFYDRETGRWEEADDGYFYDALYIARVVPGDYHFGTINLMISDNKENRYIAPFYGTFHFNTGFDVPANRITNLGAIEIEMTGKNWSASFNTSGAEATENITALMALQTIDPAQAYTPRLSFRYQPAMDRFLGNNRVWDIWTRRYSIWRGASENYTLYGDRNRLIFKKTANDALTYNQRLPNPVAVPRNYDVLWKSRWESGSPDSPYGFTISTGDGNTRYFAINGYGRADIGAAKSGRTEIPVIDLHPSEATPVTPASQTDGIHSCRVEVRNGCYSYFVNDKPAGSFTVLSPSENRNTNIGFFSANTGVVEFYNFVMIEQ